MNELTVIAKSKELSKAVFEITEKSPKKFRFTLVSRMQNLSLDVIAELYTANDIYLDNRIIADINKSINYTKNIKQFSSEEERIHYKNKLFELKFNKAEKLESLIAERLGHSYRAVTNLRELDWLVTLSAEMQCITAKQQQRLAGLIYETRKLIGGFIKSDKKRFNH